MPTLRVLAENPGGLTTAQIIAMLRDRLQPDGRLKETLRHRRDSVFSQRVRNLLGSHKTLERAGLVASTGFRRPYKITEAGAAAVARDSELREPDQAAAFAQAFEHHLAGIHSSAFLFVGAGIANRYLGLQGWGEILRDVASLTTKPLGYFVTSSNNRYPEMASEIAKELFPIWWNEPEFEESRSHWGGRISRAESPFKVELAIALRRAVQALPTTGTLAEELELLRSAVIDGIITTNYDDMLADLFPTFYTYVGQDQLLFSETQSIGEIYQIHGSWNDPESLVITASDFERFNSRNPYLAAKLITLFVEHPIIFLGYSMSDSNVVELLRSVARILTTDNLPRLADRLLFVRVAGDTPTIGPEPDRSRRLRHSCSRDKCARPPAAIRRPRGTEAQVPGALASATQGTRVRVGPRQ
jgi:hypothetical protein